MHLTTMQLIFGPRVDIQHFNVSSCQQLASLNYAPHYYTADLYWSKSWIFNILMCPLANNWPPQYYAPHYYATDLWSKVDIQHFNVSSCNGLLNTMHLTTMQLIFGPRWIFNILMCPLANNWPPHCTSLLCNWSLVQRWIFNILMCPLANNWPPQYYAPHYYATDLWSKWIFNILMCPLANNWPPQYYASLLCGGSLVQVDIQHFMCPLPWQLNTMHLTAMQLIFWSKEWIFNILMCPHARLTGLLNTMHLTTMQLIFGSSGYSTF
jgi:hypothetical protein